MGFLRNVVSDLVEKRLWPVAVLLVLAMAAAPVLLGGADPEPAATAVLPPAPAEAPAARGQVAVELPVPANRERKGKLRNPFRQPEAESEAPVPSVATAPAASAPAAPEEPASVSPLSPTPPSSTPSTPPTTTPVEPSAPKPAAPKADPLDSYRITLRFGEAGKVKTRRDLARLTPLPSADDPFFVFLGVLEGGKRAVFLVSADATPTGDGVCKPRPTACETIELRVGDTEFFDLERPSGPVQYELQLRSIRKDGDASPSEAVAARARASKAGAEVLRTADAAAVEGIDGYRFSRRTGLLERTPVASRSRTQTADAATAGAPAPTPAPDVPAAAAPAAAAAAAVVAEPAAEVRRQDRRTRAAVRAIVRGVTASLPAGRR